MPKPHWTHQTGPYGCQETTCTAPATHQWQREATPQEVERELNLTGPYGPVIRNTTGPHTTAVFACANHIPTLNTMTKTHDTNCPAPDPGCNCA